MTNVLVTGGAGFIGSNFVRHALTTHPDWRVTTLDKLTYAGRLENLKGVIDHPRHEFVKGDVADPVVAGPLVIAADIVVHFAAETHVDRSLMNAGEFITTDVYGTFVLLEAAREAPKLRKFVQISTDEVYGSIPEGSSRETDELRPRNPYSASKAGADRLAYSYWATYQVPVVITRASNNYGPNQFPEKVIPLFITNAMDDRQVPLYGDGLNVRDWLHVSDNCRALDLIIDGGDAGRGLQRRRRQPREERRSDAAHPAAPRQARVADSSRRRSPGARPPLLGRYRQAARARLDAAHRLRTGTGGHGAWYQQNEWWWRPIKEGDPAFQAYYKTQYRRPPGLRSGCGWSPTRHGRYRVRGQSPRRTPVSQREPAASPPGRTRAASPVAARDPKIAWDAVDLLDRDAVRDAIASAAALGGVPLRRRRRRRDIVGRSRHAAQGQRARHAPSARGGADSRARTPSVVLAGSATVYRASADAVHGRVGRSARRARTASASSRRKCSPHGSPRFPSSWRGRSITPGRGSRRHLSPRASRGRSQRSRPAPRHPVLSVGNLDARRDITDVRDTVRAYRMLAESGRPGRPYNICSGRAYRIGDLLEMMLGAGAGADPVASDPARLRPIGQSRDRLAIPPAWLTEMGWRATIPIEDTLKDLLDYWRHRVAAARV